ncbi:hypothetical protein EDB86DRAFT_2922339 [Lactarius hatsudake]|nr:hypothetical protein EDB86DRAFT_2922339 [Lactarius hatsudake]
MEPSRTTREQRSGIYDDDTGTGGQFDNPISKGSQDNTGGQGGDTFTPQRLGQSGYDEYGTNTAGTGPGGIDTQSDRYATSGQYGGQTSQTAGYADPNRNITGGGGRRPEDDDDYSTGVGNAASGVGKPSITSRVKDSNSAFELPFLFFVLFYIYSHDVSKKTQHFSSRATGSL